MKVKGTDGNDVLEGTQYDDEMYGFDGDDIFSTSDGADIINGGEGSDTVNYGFSVQRHFLRYLDLIFIPSVNIDLEQEVQHGVFAEGDRLISIENISGGFAEDIIKGNSEDNKLAGWHGADHIEGRDGDDILFGDNDRFEDFESEEDDVPEGDGDFLDGGNGNDTLYGDGGDDILLGGAGNDDLFGGLDDDLLRGGSGFNKLDGGSGFDTTSYGDAAHGIQVTFTNTNQGVVLEQGGNTFADSFKNVEHFIGTNFADTMTGSTLSETFESGGGNDLLDGRGGADTLIGGNGIDTVTYAGSTSAVSVNLGVVSVVNGVFTQTTDGTGSGGDAQGDILNGIENLTGSAFADTLTGNLLANRLDGGAGNDTIQGGDGSDTLIGGTGINVLDGGAGNDTASYDAATAGVTVNLANGSATGAGLTDTLISIENITGSNFADTITGSSGNNLIQAGGGNDLIAGGAGTDSIFGGSGVDTVTYAASSAGVSVTLGGPTNGGSGGDATGDTIREVENLIGSNFADTLKGDSNANRIEGGAGDDTIDGGFGSDVIAGGTGSDFLRGGVNADTFLYLARSDSLAGSADNILDFEVSNDKLDLSALGINAGQILIQNATSGGINSSIVTEDANGNGLIDSGEFSIAVTINGPSFVTLQDILL
jgi:Ca2+-binding RTX toxin-like protein